MEPASDLTLIARLHDGDAAAFDAVHARFSTPLFNFLARLSRRRDVAEDLLEETWLRLVTHASALQADTRLGAWLFTVARNLYVSYCRSRLLEDAHASDLLGLWPSGCPLPSPFEQMAATETERRVEAALAALPVTSREALLLVSVHGMSPSEAAGVCGLSPEAMRKRLSRARAQMARHLDDSAVPRLTHLREVKT